jgi:hypothetical protein
VDSGGLVPRWLTFQTARAECVPSRRYEVTKLTKFSDGPEGDPWEKIFRA